MDGMKAPKDLGVGHGTDGSIPESAAGDTPTAPATRDSAAKAPQVMGRNEPVGGAGKSGD